MTSPTIITQVIAFSHFLLKHLSQTQKNVSEPQTGIKPATFWSPVGLK